jgi:hypothetical protein
MAGRRRRAGSVGNRMNETDRRSGETGFGMFLRHISTGPGNATFEPANVMAIAHCGFTLAAAIAGVGMWLWKAYGRTDLPDLQAFGLGLAGVGVAVSAAIFALGRAQKDRGDAK